MFPLKNTEAYIHANGYRSTLGKELAARDAEISELGSEIQALTNQLTDEVTTRSALGAHNLLPLTLASLKASTSGGSWADNVYTNGDVSFTISTNNAGYVTKITANGTAGASDAYFKIITNLDSYLVAGTEYILSGCPAGGGQNSYLLYTGSAGVWDDAGAGNKKTYASTIKSLYIKVKAGTTVTNLEFYPMIRLATDADPTYQPYAKTNVELTANMAEIKNGITLGGYFTGNIDKINNQYGYMYAVDKSKASGTYPTGSGSVFLLMGFSSINSSENVVYGVQIALSFTTSTIHIRHSDYTAGGGTWGAWSQLS